MKSKIEQKKFQSYQEKTEKNQLQVQVPTHERPIAPDTSIEDACREMDKYWRSWGFRWLLIRSRTHYLWLRFVCAVTAHKPKEWGAKYWTDYGYEYDGGIKCQRCGLELR